MANSILRNKLKSYSFFGGTLMAVTGAQGQVIHTDTDPDVEVSCLNGVYELDLNNDGICDFKIKENHAALGSSFWKFEVVAEAEPGNSIAGIAGAERYNDGDTVDSFLDWNDDPIQPLASRVGSWTSDGNSQGKWVDEDDKFMALRFNIGNAPHFGWVRLSVDDGFSATIHDYAYEASESVPIMAGKQAAAVIISASQIPGFDFSSENKILQVASKERFGGEMQVEIISIPGQVIRNVKTGNNSCSINLNDQPVGLYMISIQAEGILMHQKFLLK